MASLVAQRGADTLFRTSYTRDSLSRITQLIERLNGVTDTTGFSYDSVGRLQTVTRNGTTTASYTYDLNGNRATKVTSAGTQTATVDDQDRLLAYGNASFHYTANGEVRRKIVGTDTTVYTYDALGNLTQVDLPDGTLVGYLIDAQNRRIGKTVNGTLTTAWLYQGQLTPVAELDGSGNVVSRFVYATGVNVPDYLVKPGAGGDSTYRLLRDHLGSVRLVVNVASGSVAQRVRYDEFGIETENTNPGWQPFGYAGGLSDPQTGLVRFGARDYDPATGRWTAKDPIGFAGGTTSLYSYVGADPISFTDPAGEFGIVGALLSGGIELAVQLALSGGKLECVDWWAVGVAGVSGALGGAAIGGAFKLTKGSMAAENAVRRYRRLHKVQRTQDVHHWAIEKGGKVAKAIQRMFGKEAKDAIVNHPANLNPIDRAVHQDVHNLLGPAARWIQGTPAWAKAAQTSAAVGAAGEVASAASGGCGC